MPENDDLWGETKFSKITTPKSILLAQASHLQSKVGGVVRCMVQTYKLSPGQDSFGRFGVGDSNINHDLVVIAPTLDNYRFAIVEVFHNINIYPCYVFSSIMNDSAAECSNELKLKDRLKAVFQSEHTRNVISALVSQASDEDDIPF